MNAFWAHGFAATSMADLVEATGSTRQSIYGDFESKNGLYRACFDRYREQVVLPALAHFGDGGGSTAIAAYFEAQISLAERVGLPGPGCLVGNAMTETAPGNDAVRKEVEAHNERLERAFASVLPPSWPDERRRELAQFLVVAAQGLWALSRVTPDAAGLRARAATIVQMIEREISGDS